ncbi:MAG: hypothetical protein HY047_06070 [Acidobacteria bacterium]|nr:hypothetical protein [Acidobacteriota bacterium]
MRRVVVVVVLVLTISSLTAARSPQDPVGAAPESSRYLAGIKATTNRSHMNAFWRPKIYGFRSLPPAPAE